MPSTSRTPTTREEMFPKRPPVPWVAVEIAPASGLRVHVALVLHREPARAQLLAELAQRDAGLDGHLVALHGEHAPHAAPGRPSRPSVQAMSVKEWPEPATFTRDAPATTRASSSSEPGRSMRSGAQRCWRAQLVQRSGTGPAASSAPWAARRPADSAGLPRPSQASGAQWASGSIGVSRR